MLKVNDTNNGVTAFVGGLKAQNVAAKVQECQTGQCSCACDPEMMKKIENIEISAEENGVSITITGHVKADELEPMMKECLL